MSLYSLFETNEAAELDGFELILFDNDVEIRFTLARAGGSNRKFATRMQALLRPYERAIKAGTMSDDKAADIMCQTIAETVIMDWDNVNDRDGNPLQFSVSAAKQLLLDLPELRTIILEEAQKAVNFIAEEVEQNSGN